MAKVLRRFSYVDVVGVIWMPTVMCSLRINVRPYDVEHMRDDDGTITRSSVEDWLTTHSGDFRAATDFRASIEDGNDTIDIEFATEGGEMAYYDTMGDVE